MVLLVAHAKIAIAAEFGTMKRGNPEGKAEQQQIRKIHGYFFGRGFRLLKQSEKQREEDATRRDGTPTNKIGEESEGK